MNVTGTRAEDMMMALHRDFSTPVSAGEGACGGLVDRVLSQPMRCLVIFDQNDKSSFGRQVTR